MGIAVACPLRPSVRRSEPHRALRADRHGDHGSTYNPTSHGHEQLGAGNLRATDTMPIETDFDVALIAKMALREKQIQQHYRPIIAVHKWFARRPGTLFRGLTLAEFGDRPLSESFFAANDFPGRTVADPFMGGGTPAARSEPRRL